MKWKLFFFVGSLFEIASKDWHLGCFPTTKGESRADWRFYNIELWESKGFIINCMDFELLYNLIPKPSQTWSVNDIEIWLRFIGLEQYIDQFRIVPFT